MSFKSPPRSVAASARIARSMRSVKTAVVVIAATDTSKATASKVSCPLENSRTRRRHAIMPKPRVIDHFQAQEFAGNAQLIARHESLKPVLRLFPR